MYPDKGCFVFGLETRTWSGCWWQIITNARLWLSSQSYCSNETTHRRVDATMLDSNASHNESIEIWAQNVHACCAVPPPPVTKHSLTYVFSGHYGHRCEQQLPAEISNRINQQLQCSGIGHYDNNAKDLPHPIKKPLVRIDISPEEQNVVW